MKLRQQKTFRKGKIFVEDCNKLFGPAVLEENIFKVSANQKLKFPTAVIHRNRTK
jgi:hypothetical protein